MPTTDPENLARVVKAYDVRGTVPDQVDETLATRLGGAFVELTEADAVVVGHDMRASSPALAAAFADGVAAAGADVVRIGRASTDQLYFASGRLGLPGAMVTASHNPARYNGFKLCRAHAVPVGQDSGLDRVRDLAAADPAPPGRRGRPGGRGRIRDTDVLEEYARHLLALAPVTGRRLRVVVDAGNGMAGLTVPAVLGRVPAVTVLPLWFELDGTFPNHEANPLDPDTLVDLRHRVVAQRADLGVAFDGDADRCVLVDERGGIVSGSTLTALIASRQLAREPGATVVHNLICSRAVPEVVTELGGVPVRTRVGHSFVKATMARTGAVFGGEHSGHFYFRDFWRADSGLLAALHALAALAAEDRPLSAVLEGYDRYVGSGEVNVVVADPGAVLAALEAAYAPREGVAVDRLDGLSVEHADWWLNVRPSNTEPLLRLNAEAGDRATMERVRDEALDRIRAAAGTDVRRSS